MSAPYLSQASLLQVPAFRRMLVWSVAGHVVLGLVLVWSPRSDARPLEPLPIFVEVVERAAPEPPARRKPRQIVEEVVIPKRPKAARKPPPKREPAPTAEEILSQLREKLGSPSRPATSERSAARGRFDPEMAAYRKRIKALLYSNWAGARVFRTQGRLVVHFRVEVDADGVVRSLDLLRTSGNRHFDESAERAIWKVEPFPAPPRGAFTLTLTFDPREAA